MKTSSPSRSLAVGILLGITAVISTAIVYIDNVAHYWQYSGGFVRLVVNTNIQPTITVATNTGFIGVNTNNTIFGVAVSVKPLPLTNGATGNNAQNAGQILLTAASGGSTTNDASGTGGAGGRITLNAGSGGNAASATTNSTGGGGGGIFFTAGTGGENAVSEASTNSSTGGSGGVVQIVSGSGGSPSGASTNTVGGSGGSYTFSSGQGGSPSGGWARKGGNGANMIFTSGSGGSGVRTNGGDGGVITMSGGQGGAASTGGNAGAAGLFAIEGGAGNTATGGGTNSDGGNVFIAGGAPGSGAVPGNVVLARTSAGVTRGAGVVIGISNSAILTNVMFVRTNLDFPSTLAQTDTDIPVLIVTGRTNAVVNIGPPPSALLSGVVWSGFCSNGVVFVRCSVYGALAKDPGIGDFEVEVKAYR